MTALNVNDSPFGATARSYNAGVKNRAASETVYGLRAGLAVVEKRPADVIEGAYGRDTKREVEPALRALDRRVPARELRDEELARIAQSPHHEGLCVATAPRRW